MCNSREIDYWIEDYRSKAFECNMLTLEYQSFVCKPIRKINKNSIRKRSIVDASNKETAHKDGYTQFFIKSK